MIPVVLFDAHQVAVSCVGEPEICDTVKLQGADGTV